MLMIICFKGQINIRIPWMCNIIYHKKQPRSKKEKPRITEAIAIISVVNLMI